VHTRARTLTALLAASALVVAGCATGSTPGAASPTPRGTTAASPTPPLPPCRSASNQPPAPSGPVAGGPLWTVASGMNKPDDLLYSNGSLLIGSLGAGTISVLSPGKPATVLPVQIPAVEGMVYIGQSLYAAGQTQDVVVRIDGSQVHTVIQLQPVPGLDGVDGITAQGGQLIVPDSPHGVVDWVDPATGHITKQVGGFVRPTGAWPAPDGSLLLADEFGNAAVRLAPDGTRTYLVRGLPIVDDIAQDGQGDVFVVTPVVTGGRLVQLVNGNPIDLASHLAAPQSVVVDGAGNLYFTEEDAGRVDLLIRSFKLVPLAPLTASSTQPVCVDVARAPGFTGDIALRGTSGITVLQQPGAGTRGSILVTGCHTGACELTASSGTRTDALWIQT
jgi:hypothetical protein